MAGDPLHQRTVFVDDARVAARLPLGESLGRLHPGGFFPLLRDPRETGQSVVLGMMVLRPAVGGWRPANVDEEAARALHHQGPWCYDVAGVGGSWPISAGNAVDALRLAMQYGTVDAVLAGSATMAREGAVVGGRRGHLWQSSTPLGWKALRSRRPELEPAIAALRRDWQELGVLSARAHPVQVAVSESGAAAPGCPDLLDARVFRDRQDDGTPIEARILTSEQGAGRLRERARARGRRIDDLLLVVSSPGAPARIDVGAVPRALRERLDVRLAEHDGGGRSLEAFVAGGAVHQLQLTLMRGRSVADVLAGSGRLGEDERDEVLRDWPRRARTFPAGGRGVDPGWRPACVVVEDGRAGEAVVVTVDPGAGPPDVSPGRSRR